MFKNYRIFRKNLLWPLKFRPEAGQAMMIATIAFLVISLTAIFGLIEPVVRQQKISRSLLTTRQSYFLASAGIEDVVYRLVSAQPVGTEETLSLAGSITTTVTSDTDDGKEILSTADVQDKIRKIKIKLLIGEGVSFFYGVHVGAGGFTFSNNAGVNGNVYSNANISGSNGAFVTGSVSAVGTINNILVGTGTIGDAYAPTVTNSTIRGTLYCQSGSGNNKSCNTTLANPTAKPFPITDEQIDGWKEEALVGGIFVGNKNLSGTNNVLGPLKIQGNLTLANNSKLTITGTLWVTGSINLSNGSRAVLDPSYGSSDGVVVVDGQTTLSNGSLVDGSGAPGSYVMLLSTSSSSNAINLSNNAGAVILYAPNGTVQLSNNSFVESITAKTISLSNGAVIDYEQGLISTVFSSGPSGGYQMVDWEEVE